ncbi:MAG: sigma-70 family RNA polymerase sigma factor [Burkholderiaceae bacterium]
MLQTFDEELTHLLDRVSLRDALAFKQLYELCSPKLFGLAIRVMDNRSWAEEVMQDAFLVIWRTASDYRGSLSPPMAWMGLIVRSRGLDHRRRRARQHGRQTHALDTVVGDSVAADIPSPMDAAQASEQASALHQCLRQLGNRQREVVTLAYVRDLSHSELAAQLQLPLGTIKTWMRRGIEQLRACMARFA